MADDGLSFNARRILDPGFFDLDRCDRWLADQLHPDGFHCPYCLMSVPAVSHNQFLSGRAVQCRQCKRQFTVRSGTQLAGCHFTTPELFLLVLLSEMKFTKKEISQCIGRDRGTISRMIGRLSS
jgi:transposase-like protein